MGFPSAFAFCGSAGEGGITILEERYNRGQPGYNFRMQTRRISPVFPVLAYAAGLLVGLFLVLVATWADMESAFYGFPRVASAGLPGFSCPILMTRNDSAAISLTVSNPTQNKISPAIKTEVSTPTLPEEFLANLELAPGESKKLAWRVDADNIDLGNFIFAKVLLYSAYPLASRETTCGIFILDLPGSGQVIVPALAALSLLGMGWGLYALARSDGAAARRFKNLRGALFLAAMLVLGFVLSLTGRWMQAIMVLAVILLALIILLGPSLLADRRER